MLSDELAACECDALRDCRLHSQQRALCHMALEKGGGLAANMSATMKSDKVLGVAETARNRILASAKVPHDDTISLEAGKKLLPAAPEFV